MEKIKSKITAKKLFESGHQIRIVPNKINPTNLWGLYADIQKLESNSILEMDDIRYCNDFEVYNCNNETGKYLSYYLIKGAK